MARSIHETRRAWKEEWCKRHRRENLSNIARALNRKRFIKRQVHDQRRHANLPGMTSPEFIPLHVYDESDVVHYPASPHDIRETMRRLPGGVMDGLHSVTLCQGREAQEELLEDPERLTIDFHSDEDRDPFTGRLSDSAIPTLAYSGPLLGAYMPDTQKIVLHAYVYEAGIPDRGMWELYMRLRMLATFVHEVAHHWDFTFRMARGRWCGDDYDKNEEYAERMAFSWLRDCVVPYLEDAYPEDVQALRAWMCQHGGSAISLVLVACRDPSKQPRFHSAPGAFYDLMEDAFEDNPDERKEALQVRLWFARWLRWAGHDEEAREVARAIRRLRRGSS